MLQHVSKLASPSSLLLVFSLETVLPPVARSNCKRRMRLVVSVHGRAMSQMDELGKAKWMDLENWGRLALLGIFTGG